jgi:hypothetical protein
MPFTGYCDDGLVDLNGCFEGQPDRLTWQELP